MITQADRDRACRIMAARWSKEDVDNVRSGYADDWFPVQECARHREQARRDALEEAANEVEAWFPCGTIDKPEFAAGKALRDAIRRPAPREPLTTAPE